MSDWQTRQAAIRAWNHIDGVCVFRIAEPLHGADIADELGEAGPLLGSC